MDGADDVLLCLDKGHEGHHYTHGAGQSLFGAIAGVDWLSSLAQHKYVFSVAPPRLAGHILLFRPGL